MNPYTELWQMLFLALHCGIPEHPVAQRGMDLFLRGKIPAEGFVQLMSVESRSLPIIECVLDITNR